MAPGEVKTGRFPILLFLPFCLGIFIAADDQTVVVTILPEIMRDLRVSAGELDRAAWAVTGYLIGYTAAMPLMGRFSDRVGYRTAFLVALGIFIAGSAAVAVSPMLPRWLYGGEPQYSWLVGARVFQAAGGGAVIPISLAAAGHLIPPAQRPVAYGLIGASAEAGGVVGPLWGGAVTELWSWHWAFWLNIPLALLVVALMFRIPAAAGHRTRMDVAGGVFFGAALALFTVVLSRAGQWDSLTWSSLVAAIALSAAFAWRQATSNDPIIPPAAFSRLTFNAASVAHFLVGAALIIAMVTVPLMANVLLGDDPLEGGLRLLRMTLAIGCGALAGGFLVQRLGPRAPALSGVALCLTGFLLMSRWTLDIADPWMTVHLAVTGIGFGLLVSPIAHSALQGIGVEHQGGASAMLTVARMVGMTAGLAALTSWGTVRFAELVAGSPAFSTDPAVQEQVLAEAQAAGLVVFRGFFTVAAAISAAMLVPVWVMTRRT